MNAWLAFVWLILIGGNIAEYYSLDAPYQAAIILVGTGYFLFVFRSRILQLVFFSDWLLGLGLLAVPILLMVLSDHSFDRNTYTSMVAVALTFVIASVLGSQADLDRAWTRAAFVIVCVGVVLNLYELFVQSNTWSIAPGRSAGLYINPNISAEALVGYGLLFLVTRSGKFDFWDLALVVLVMLGVFATFSRAGILAGIVLLAFAAWWRTDRKHLPRLVFGGAALMLLGFLFAYFVVHNLDLSEDASVRVLSLIKEGGIGDYEEDRGLTALNSLELAMEHPVTGNGVGTIAELPEGPHNMFIAMMVEFGFVGLFAYLTLIARLSMRAWRRQGHLPGVVWSFVAWLVIFSFTSHNLMGNTATIPLMGFAVACAYRIRAAARRRQWVNAYT